MSPTKHRARVRRVRPAQAGFSLIELMIALLLGLLVVAAAGGVFISNKRVYSATETLGRIQENTRVAFELMSRDLREAGGNPCGSATRPRNMLTTATYPFWDRFAEGLTGYDTGDVLPLTATGTAAGQRVAGTDAVEIHSALGGGVRVTDHDNPSAQLSVTSIDGFADGDILLVCNVTQSFIFQVTGFTSSGGVSIQHNGGGGQSLNCSAAFNIPPLDQPELCQGGATQSYCFTAEPSGGPGPCAGGSIAPAYVVRIGSIQWYVGNNGRGGTSLYRAIITNRSGTATPNTLLSRDEIAEGVRDMTITYLEQGESDYTNAAGVTDWGRVLAARVELVMEGAAGAQQGRELQGTDGEVLSRTISNVVSLRNREGTL